MRKNTQQVFAAWNMGRRNHRQYSIWTDGGAIYSYGTALVTMHSHEPYTVVFNVTKYSSTTSRHQNGIREIFRLRGWTGEIVEVDNLPRGASVLDLFNAGAEKQTAQKVTEPEREGFDPQV